MSTVPLTDGLSSVQDATSGYFDPAPYNLPAAGSTGTGTTAAAASTSVTKLTLVDAVTNKPLYELTDGATINLAQMANRQLTVIAETAGTIGSLKFGVDGNANYWTENGAPYALENNGAGDYNPWKLGVGAHTITATAFGGMNGTGAVLGSKSVSFTIVDGTSTTPPATPPPATVANAPAINSATLYDAVTDRPLHTLTNGATINLATLANKQLSVLANVNGYTKSVKFGYDANANFRTESAAPFSMTGDTNYGKDIWPWTPTVGTHTLTLTGYTGTGATGTASTPLKITFTVVDQPATTPPPAPVVNAPAVNSATLYDAVTDRPLYTLTNGATIDLAKLANKGLSVLANVNGYTKSVKFGYDSNANYRIESAAPFTMTGDGNGGRDFYAWTPTVGTHTLTITGYAGTGATGTASTPLRITFTVVNTATTTPTPTPTPVPGDTNPTNGNQAPTVSFINPTANSTQAAPGHYVIRVNAADADGKVAKVDFFANGTLISSTADAPYSAAWVNVTAGTYTLSARATDDDGATKTTNITVTIQAPVAGNTYYVSTSGNDGASGSSSSPLRSINKAVSLANAGDTIVVRAGTYRESIVLTKNGTAAKPITIKAEQPGTVVVDGADAVNGWTRDGSTSVYSANWAHDFFYSGTSRVHTSATDIGYAEQFFYKDRPLKQVLSKSGMSAGSFYVDWNANKVFVWLPDNTAPGASATVYGSTRSALAAPSSSTTGKFTTIDGITFRHAANFAQRPAVKTTDGWVLKNSRIEWTAAIALGVYGTDNFIYNNKINDNGQEGMMGTPVNALIADNEVWNNNWKGYRVAWEGGGAKMTRTDGLYLLNHNAHHNVGPGFWLDVYNVNYTIDGGFFHDNRGLKATYEGMGLMIEINGGLGRVQGTSYYGNTGAGLSLAESSNVTIRGNYFGDSLEMRNMSGRAYSIRNINITSNYFKGAQITNSIGTWTSTSFRDFNIKASLNKFDNGGGTIYRYLGKNYYNGAGTYAALGVDKDAILGSVTIPTAG